MRWRWKGDSGSGGGGAVKAELGPGVTHGSLGNATFPACSSGINHFHCDGYRRTIPAFPNHGIMEYQNHFGWKIPPRAPSPNIPWHCQIPKSTSSPAWSCESEQSTWNQLLFPIPFLPVRVIPFWTTFHQGLALHCGQKKGKFVFPQRTR